MLGEAIRVHRKAAGMTQQSMGQALKLAQNTIAQYESGKRTPTVGKLLEISALLGCSVADLLQEEQRESGAVR